VCHCLVFFFSSRRRHTRSKRDWSSDVCSSDLSSMTTPGFPFSSSAFVEKTVKSAMASTFGLPSGFWNLLEFRDPFGSMMMRVAEECSAGLKKPPPPAEAPLSMSSKLKSDMLAGSLRIVLLDFAVLLPGGPEGALPAPADVISDRHHIDAVLLCQGRQRSVLPVQASDLVLDIGR